MVHLIQTWLMFCNNAMESYFKMRSDGKHILQPGEIGK